MSWLLQLLPIAGFALDWRLHQLSQSLAKEQQQKSESLHKESEETAKLLSTTELNISTVSAKLESYRDSCEEKLKKYSNYLLLTMLVIGILGQMLPLVLPEHNKYIIGTSIPLIHFYYLFLSNTVGCILMCFISCIVIINDISYYMTHINNLWANIETTCLLKLSSTNNEKFIEIQELLSTEFYTLYNSTKIVTLEGWICCYCNILHYIITFSACIGFISFIVAFILSLEAILIPIDIMATSKSYTSFILVLVIVTLYIITLFVYLYCRKKKEIHWYNAKTNRRFRLTNNPISIQLVP
jgi:hypothetical protein